MANKKDPKEKETIETTATENTEETINNENTQEESIMNENVNNTQAQQENAQATENTQAPAVKEKKHMPNWLKVTLIGLGGAALGVAGTLGVQHFTGNEAQELANNMFD